MVFRVDGNAPRAVAQLRKRRAHCTAAAGNATDVDLEAGPMLVATELRSGRTTRPRAMVPAMGAHFERWGRGRLTNRALGNGRWACRSRRSVHVLSGKLK